jgi:hypothetical protein
MQRWKGGGRKRKTRGVILRKDFEQKGGARVALLYTKCIEVPAKLKRHQLKQLTDG